MLHDRAAERAQSAAWKEKKNSDRMLLASVNSPRVHVTGSARRTVADGHLAARHGSIVGCCLGLKLSIFLRREERRKRKEEINDRVPDVRQGQMCCVLKCYIKANGENSGGLMAAPSA